MCISYSHLEITETNCVYLKQNWKESGGPILENKLKAIVQVEGRTIVFS